MKIEFSTYCKDEKTSDIVIYDDKRVEYTRYSNDLMSVPFLFQPVYENVEEFIHSRCMDERRNQLPEYLETLGLTAYDPWKIVEITHGVMWEDFLWIKFPGETLSWEDVKIRD